MGDGEDEFCPVDVNENGLMIGEKLSNKFPHNRETIIYLGERTIGTYNVKEDYFNTYLKISEGRFHVSRTDPKPSKLEEHTLENLPVWLGEYLIESNE